MYLNRRKLANQRPAKLVVTKARIGMAHFKTAADRRKALANLPHSEHPRTPYDLAKLVKDKKIPERYIVRVLLKAGGMTRAVPPRQPSTKVPFKFSLGKPFIKTGDGPSILAAIAQAFPQGFRQPSPKPKNWRSTSLIEKVMGVKQVFEGSTRRQLQGESIDTFRARMAKEHQDYLDAVRAGQDDRNVDPKYLNAGRRRALALVERIAA